MCRLFSPDPEPGLVVVGNGGGDGGGGARVAGNGGFTIFFPI